MNNSKIAYSDFSCIILAAGQSKRMKQSKIILPWGKTTVIGAIISAFQQSRVQDIVVVTGGYREKVEEEVGKFGVKSAFNPDFENGEMTFSLRIGLQQVNKESKAVFIALGDQPG